MYHCPPIKPLSTHFTSHRLRYNIDPTSKWLSSHAIGTSSPYKGISLTVTGNASHHCIFPRNAPAPPTHSTLFSNATPHCASSHCIVQCNFAPKVHSTLLRQCISLETGGTRISLFATSTSGAKEGEKQT